MSENALLSHSREAYPRESGERESSLFTYLNFLWTPASAEGKTFYEIINVLEMKSETAGPSTPFFSLRGKF